MSYKQIYPPWYEIATLLYYTIGQDPGVHIIQPKCESPHLYTIGIRVDYRQQADYIRVIIPTEYRSGNTIIHTVVYSQDDEVCFPCVPQKNQRDIANVFCNALRNNPLFLGVFLIPQNCVPLKSSIEVAVVQSCIPTSGGYYKNDGMTVADAFAQVTKLCYGLLISTEVFFRGYCERELDYGCLYCKGCRSL